jgi:hypothetical protein
MEKFGKALVIASLGAVLWGAAAGCSNDSTDGFHAYGDAKPITVESPKTQPAGGTQPVPGPAALGSPATPGAPQPANGSRDAGGSADTGNLQPSSATKKRPGDSSPAALASATATGPPRADVASLSVPADGQPSVGRRPAEASRPAPRKVQLLVPTREFKTEGPEAALRVTYDDIDLLKVLNMEPVTPDAPALMPPWLKSLDGRRIRIRGFMYPTFQESGIRGFGLARDNQICCFGRDPKIYDVFDVALREGVVTDYISGRPFDVVGVFHIRPDAEDGKLLRLYEMDDAIVIAK